MRLIQMRERSGDELEEYKTAIKMAKKAIDTIYELTEDMADEFSERGGSRNYGERYNERRGGGSRNYGERYSDRGGMYGREWKYMPDNREWTDMQERGYDRDSMGRFR